MVRNADQIHRLQKDRFFDPAAVQKNSVPALVVYDCPSVPGMEKSGMLSGDRLSLQGDLLISSDFQRHHLIAQRNFLPLHTRQLEHGYVNDHVMLGTFVVDSMDAEDAAVIELCDFSFSKLFLIDTRPVGAAGVLKCQIPF